MHSLVQQSWNQQIIPDEWKEGVIIPLHKKGNQMQFKNYRGIALQSHVYKGFPNILFQRLSPYTKEIIGDYAAFEAEAQELTSSSLSVRF